MNIDKIAFVARVYGHLESFHIPFMKLLIDKGYEVHAYAGFDHGKNSIEALGVTCHDTPFARSALSLRNVPVVKNLVRSFKQQNFKLVHFHTPIASIIGRVAAKLARVPVTMYTAHGFHFLKGGPLSHWLVYYPIERIGARFTDYLLTINHEDYVLAQQFPVKKEVIYIPGVGLDTKRFQLLDEAGVRGLTRLKLGIETNDFLVICLAELNTNKNQIQLIKAMEKLVQYDKTVKCLIVGTGSDKDYLDREIKQRKLKDHIYLLGFRRDVLELLCASDVVVLLSKREGLPKSLMEAMAAGKPIVATMVRGNKDLVIDGQNGILVPIGDVETTVQALLSLRRNKDLAQVMGAQNRISVQQYDLERIIAIMDDIYSKALSLEG